MGDLQHQCSASGRPDQVLTEADMTTVYQYHRLPLKPEVCLTALIIETRTFPVRKYLFAGIKLPLPI
eukprot:3324167-Amphidinium_carterae.1